MSDSFSKGGEDFNTYQKIYAFHKKYKDASTKEVWNEFLDEMGQFTEDFEIDLAVAVFNRLEKTYKEKILLQKERRNR